MMCVAVRVMYGISLDPTQGFHQVLVREIDRLIWSQKVDDGEGYIYEVQKIT